MKVFKYKFTKAITVFIYLGLALAVAAVAADTYLIIAEGIKSAANPVYPIIQYTLMYLVGILLFIILLSLLISSYYSIEGTTLKTSFGIIKSKYDIKKFKNIILNRNTGKLSVYSSETDFMMIVVKEEWYEEFIDALLKVNPEIEYTIESKENTPDDNGKK